jgi:ABC-type phosphate/phosphonate transport system substrate-binding protein
MLDYLSAKLERPVELVQRRTYTEVNDLIAKEGVDVAFVCTSVYVARGTAAHLRRTARRNRSIAYLAHGADADDEAAMSCAGVTAVD